MEDLPTAFWRGVDQFNQGEFYACHDTLEALWMEASEPQKTFYQGILQIAVALYHLGNQNWRGAVILLGEGLARVCDYQPTYAGLDITRLVAESSHLLHNLQQAGPERVAEFSQRLVEREAASDPSAPAIVIPTLSLLAP